VEPGEGAPAATVWPTLSLAQVAELEV
jgi:hypothetical protein